MTPGSQLGEELCQEFDSFANAPSLRGRETPEAFIQRVYSTHLKGDERKAFEALLWILKTQTGYVYQNLAGTLLVQFEVPCRIGLDEFIEILLHNFNASANYTVNYIVKSFGEDKVKAKVRALRESDLTPKERRHVDSLRYWLGEQPGMA